MLQDLLGNFIPFLKKTDSLVAGIIGTAGCVGLWGYLLYQGVVDPLGGVKSLCIAVRYFQPDAGSRSAGTGHRCAD